MGITPNSLAVNLGVPSQRIYEILSGKRSISLDTALRLGKFFGTSYTLWLGLQTDYEYQVAQDNGLLGKIEHEVRPLAPEKRTVNAR